MKTLILTEGGKDVGFGHLSRCVALSQAIKERDGTAEIKFIVDGDTGAAGFLKGEKANSVSFLDWREKESRTAEAAQRSDMVIIDSYLAEKPLYDSVSDATGGRVLMIDDYNRVEYPKGMVVNPSVFAERMDYPRRDGTVYFLGKEYIILRKEFWDIPEKEIKREIRNVLVTFGGMDNSGLLRNIVEYLRPKFNFHFNMIDVRKGRVSTRTMLDMMLAADLCISAGGQTTYELARVGVPAVGICFAENQKFNLKGLQEGGFIEYAGWFNAPDLPSKVSGSIARLADHGERVERSRAGKNLVSGNGAKTIAKTMFDRLKETDEREA
ncbi:MAG: hypothetical protein KAS86_03960 [Candidatus Omnitrophica bacterium]|nr:hypothetical protein [Candidatus Omnitrophota bacterium]